MDSNVIFNLYFCMHGAGRRLCVGDRIARMQMFLLLTTMLRNFEFSLPEGALPDFNVDGGNFTLAAAPYDIIVREAKSTVDCNTDAD